MQGVGARLRYPVELPLILSPFLAALFLWLRLPLSIFHSLLLGGQTLRHCLLSNQEQLNQEQRCDFTVQTA